MCPSSIDPSYRADYQATVRERIGELEALLEAPSDAAALSGATRAVHSVKGAAAAIGDELTTWYCHGLETALRRPDFDPRQLGTELPRIVSVLISLVDDPTSALDTLRPRSVRPSRPSGFPARRGSSPPEEDTGEQMLRVHGVSLERVLERVESIRLAQDEVSGAAAVTAREVARTARRFGGSAPTLGTSATLGAACQSPRDAGCGERRFGRRGGRARTGQRSGAKERGTIEGRRKRRAS
jgi:HPt (histidine-containing phosphotransfer) domain-containing protein